MYSIYMYSIDHVKISNRPISPKSAPPHKGPRLRLRTFNFGLEGFSRLANRRFHVPKKEKKEKAVLEMLKRTFGKFRALFGKFLRISGNFW